MIQIVHITILHINFKAYSLTYSLSKVKSLFLIEVINYVDYWAKDN